MIKFINFAKRNVKKSDSLQFQKSAVLVSMNRA